MKPNETSDVAPSISRRTAIGLGVTSGWALASLSTEDMLAKNLPDAPEIRDLSPQFKAAYVFAIKKNPFKNGPGYWAVSYAEDNFTGEPLLIGDPVFIPKPQAGAMPQGWGAKTGSIVVGPDAVLRLVHKVNNEDVHVTLLPYESMADLRTLAITDGISTWKLFPAHKLQPPY